MLMIASLLCGLLFGAGLLISGMAQPTKVLAFLDVFGAWDPSLAVVMVAGNAPVVPNGIFEPFLTLTTVIVMDMPYAAGDHRTALFGVAIVLFLISMAFVASIRLISRLGKEVG